MAFVKGPLADWIGEQAAAVYHVSLAALSGYGKAVVAIEAGLADMRFVEVVRAAPVPDEIRGDAALSEAYFTTLDEALEPRKARGRDAALVGLEKLAAVGVLADPRAERARSLLSKVYSGRRIDALDSLPLPELAPAKPKSPEQLSATRVPTFYVSLLLPKLDATAPSTLRALMERGVPASARLALDRGQAPPETERLYVRALFELGRSYWRAADFARAKEIALRHKTRGPDMPLVAALGEVLAQGPKNAAQMIVGGPHLPSGVGQVVTLDKVGKENRSLEGHAAFDAALLLELARPAGADAKYFEDVASRCAIAKKKLPPEFRKRAGERRKAAERHAPYHADRGFLAGRGAVGELRRLVGRRWHRRQQRHGRQRRERRHGGQLGKRGLGRQRRLERCVGLRWSGCVRAAGRSWSLRRGDAALVLQRRDRQMRAVHLRRLRGQREQLRAAGRVRERVCARRGAPLPGHLLQQCDLPLRLADVRPRVRRAVRRSDGRLSARLHLHLRLELSDLQRLHAGLLPTGLTQSGSAARAASING